MANSQSSSFVPSGNRTAVGDVYGHKVIVGNQNSVRPDEIYAEVDNLNHLTKVVDFGRTLVPGGGGGTADYNELENLPQINGVELSGDLSASDLGLQDSINVNQGGTTPSTPELSNININGTQYAISKPYINETIPQFSFTAKLDTIRIPGDSVYYTVPAISTDITTDQNSDIKTASPKAVKTYVDNAIPSVPVTDVTVGGTSVVSSGTAAIPAIPDTTDFIQKSNTAGLLKNDGTVDTNTYITSVHEVPSGGNAGQVLKKTSGSDYEYGWANMSETLPSAYCTTSGSTAAKKANCSLYVTQANQYLQVLIGSANTYQGALTLNINSAGDKPIYINGTVSSSTNYTLPNGTYFVFYDGTNYYFRTDGNIQGPSGTLELTSNKVTSFQTTPDNTHYPSEKLVKDSIDAADKVFWATYGTTTAAEIEAAVAAGKMAMFYYNGRLFKLEYYDVNEDIMFSNQTKLGLYTITLKRSNNTWSITGYTAANAGDKVSTISGYETDTTKYPNTKAVADALGKWGVVSQTQTWSGTGTQPRTYVMSDLVYGTIPQANIDLFESAGATFNATSGYFEINGLTDISYEEMQKIYSGSIACVRMGPRDLALLGQKIRTTLPLVSTFSFASSMSYFAYGNDYIEQVAMQGPTTGVYVSAQNQTSGAFQNCNKLKSIGLIRIYPTSIDINMFTGCYSLENINIDFVRASLILKDSSVLSLESIVYLVSNAANTSAITITLHADAYARCQADTTEYTYGGNTYTGILALATAHDITIASAS